MSQHHALLSRYRRHYGIPDDLELFPADLRRHLIVELEVANELLASAPEDRHDAFARGYTRIYDELWWFNEADDAADGVWDHSPWFALIGDRPQRIYEVGSGQASLARALARRGHEVTATDISEVRGRQDDVARVTWEQTDGIHLDRFARPGTYDVVLTEGVVEHFHPDDFLTHLRTARALLRPGGRYIFKTPHGPSGPYDSSLAFGIPAPLATHLHEYSFAERRTLLRAAGYAAIGAEYRSPRGTRASARYFDYLVAVEALLDRVPTEPRRLIIKRVLRDKRPFLRNAILVAR